MKQNVTKIRNNLLLENLSRFSGRSLLVGAFIGTVLLVVLFVVPGVKGQETPTRGISISPLTFEIKIDPGQEVTDEIRIFNSGAEPIFARIRIEDTSATGVRGQAQLEDPGSTSYSIVSWMEFTSDIVEVQPNEQRAIPFTLRVPETAEPGGHYGAITVENAPQITQTGTGASFAQKVAALILVSVKGDVNEELVLKQFFISTEQTVIRPDWIPTNWILDPKEITFVLQFKNNGSVHEKPAGFITVTNGFGAELTKIPIDQRNVFPGAERDLDMTWKPESLTMGKIRAQVDVIYGSKNEPLFAAAEFWIIPINTLGPWLIGGLIALLLVILLRKRLALALRIIIKGDKGSKSDAKDSDSDTQKQDNQSAVEKMVASDDSTKSKEDGEKPPNRPIVT